MLRKIVAFCFVLFLFEIMLFGQDTVPKSDLKEEYKGMVFEVGSGRQLKLSVTNQIWVRYTDPNPGTTVYGDPVDGIFDIGLRRTRVVISGDPHENVNVFIQMGMNNFNYISQRQAGFYFHDALADYEFIKKKLFLGAGLTAWGGFSRVSTPSIGSILGVDAPLFAQATNGATDQFLRKLSVYTKGDFDKFHYRLAVSKPMAIQRSGLYAQVDTFSTFSEKASEPQFHSYFEYSFLDQESHSTPYSKGTHLGNKKVFNVGAGFLYQSNGMQIRNAVGDTSYTNIVLLSADLFYDAPTKNNGVINVYAAYFNYDFGKKYLRNVGAMNPANGNQNPNVVNGAGAAYPMIGTGNIGYVQGGYMFGDKDNDDKVRIMPYGAAMLAKYDALKDNMFYFDLGINAFVNGHKTKFTVALQNRPVFITNTIGENEFSSRKFLIIGQLQVSI